MTQEDKDLLLKDLCARLPYEVKAQVYNHWRDEVQDETITIENLHQLIETFSIGDIKPYLFPLLSMTEEQYKECLSTKHKITKSSGKFMYLDSPNTINYYHRNHFDYRGLIPKGLAIDSTGLNIY